MSTRPVSKCSVMMKTGLQRSVSADRIHSVFAVILSTVRSSIFSIVVNFSFQVSAAIQTYLTFGVSKTQRLKIPVRKDLTRFNRFPIGFQPVPKRTEYPLSGSGRGQLVRFDPRRLGVQYGRQRRIRLQQLRLPLGHQRRERGVRWTGGSLQV